MKQNRALLEQNEKLCLELGEVTEKVRFYFLDLYPLGPSFFEP